MENVGKPLNDLARHQMLTKLFKDILVDMAVCEIEGWSKEEYIAMLHEEIDYFYKKIKNRDE